MRRSMKAPLALLALALAAVLAWWLQTGGPSAGSAPESSARAASPARSAKPAVEVAPVQRVRLVESVEALGSLQPRQGLVVRPEISGRVAAIGFAEGQMVRRGQLLVQLDDSLLQAQLRQVEAQAGIARMQWQRNQELLAQAFVSRSVVDQAAATLAVAEAQVALAKAQLARTRVLAPFDGRVGIRQVALGDFLREGADIVTLEDTSQLWVDFRLPERYLSRIATGQAVEVRIDGLDGRAFDARVTAMDAQVDSDGRALLVRARLDNPDGKLRSGMFARTRTILGVREDALVVPEEALVPQGGQQWLVQIVDGPQGPVSRRLAARLGLRQPGQVEVLEGLQAGDVVVTAGQDRLMREDGQAVQVVRIGEAGASAAEATPAARPASAAAARPAA